MKVGDKVEVIVSNHSAITPRDKGEIVCEYSKGLAVKITKIFPAPISNIKAEKETRIIYFDSNQLRSSPD